MSQQDFSLETKMVGTMLFERAKSKDIGKIILEGKCQVHRPHFRGHLGESTMSADFSLQVALVG
jgi:hypothetical protein